MFVVGETPMPETLEDALKIVEEVAKERDDFKRHSRDWEDKAKSNKDAAPLLEKATARIAELEAAAAEGQTDAEKKAAAQEKAFAELQKRVETAEATSAAEKLTALKTRIGADRKLPTALIDLLKGEDEDAIAAHADELLKAIPAAPLIPGVPGQGNQGEPQPKEDPFLLGLKSGTPAK